MGCDIHPVIEVCIRYPHEVGRVGHSYWEPRLVPYSGRNYEFFGTVAGVRDDDAPLICEPKGVPVGFNPYYFEYLLMDQGNGHSASWFTLKEALRFRKKLDTLDVEQTTLMYWDSWIADMQYALENSNPYDSYCPITHDDVRVVFNFDN